MLVKASNFFSREQQAKIREAIRKAENETSGEIRVHIETYFKGNVMDRAAWVFRKTGMHVTSARNGILFYLAIENKQYAIIGDSGINEKVPVEFWSSIKDKMKDSFAENKFTEGLIDGILMAGQLLKAHFPRTEDDVNELPDEISFDIPE